MTIKKVVSLILAVSFLLCTLYSAPVAAAPEKAVTLDIGEGRIKIYTYGYEQEGKGSVDYTGKYIITGESTLDYALILENQLVKESKFDIVLKDLTIAVNEDCYSGGIGLNIPYSRSDINIEVQGVCKLIGKNSPAFYFPGYRDENNTPDEYCNINIDASKGILYMDSHYTDLEIEKRTLYENQMNVFVGAKTRAATPGFSEVSGERVVKNDSNVIFANENQNVADLSLGSVIVKGDGSFIQNEQTVTCPNISSVALINTGAENSNTVTVEAVGNIKNTLNLDLYNINLKAEKSGSSPAFKIIKNQDLDLNIKIIGNCKIDNDNFEVFFTEPSGTENTHKVNINISVLEGSFIIGKADKDGSLTQSNTTIKLNEGTKPSDSKISVSTDGTLNHNRGKVKLINKNNTVDVVKVNVTFDSIHIDELGYEHEGVYSDYKGKYIITGNTSRSDRVVITNNTSQPATFNITLDNFKVSNTGWATVFLLLSEKDAPLTVNVDVIGECSLRAHNHPALKSHTPNASILVNLNVNWGGSIYLGNNQTAGPFIRTDNIKLKLSDSTTVSDETVNITADGYVEENSKPLTFVPKNQKTFDITNNKIVISKDGYKLNNEPLVPFKGQYVLTGTSTKSEQIIFEEQDNTPITYDVIFDNLVLDCEEIGSGFKINNANRGSTINLRTKNNCKIISYYEPALYTDGVFYDNTFTNLNISVDSGELYIGAKEPYMDGKHISLGNVKVRIGENTYIKNSNKPLNNDRIYNENTKPLLLANKSELPATVKITLTAGEYGVGENIVKEIPSNSNFTLPQNTFKGKNGESFAYWNVGSVDSVITVNKDTTIIPVFLDNNGFYTDGNFEKAPGDIDRGFKIYKAGHLFWYSQNANNFDWHAEATLMNDITINAGVLNNGKLTRDKEKIKAFRNWIPIATKPDGKGVSIYGNGHKIKGIYCVTKNAGIYSYMNDRCNFFDVALVDSYFEGDVVGSCAAESVGQIFDNYFETQVVCTSPENKNSAAGGIVGKLYQNQVLSNFVNSFVTAGENCGDICGFVAGDGILKHNYSRGLKTSGKLYSANSRPYISVGCEIMSEESVRNGELACALNSYTYTGIARSWGQNIDNGKENEGMPQLRASAIVYSKADGTYSNTPSDELVPQKEGRSELWYRISQRNGKKYVSLLNYERHINFVRFEDTKAAFQNRFENIFIFKADGVTPHGERELITSGTVIKYKKPGGEAFTDEATIVFKGDVNFDSDYNAQDYQMTVNIALGKESPSEMAYVAADCNDDGYIDVFDCVHVANKHK